MPLDLFAILGDALWILVLAAIASSSRRFSQGVPPGVRLPLWGIPVFRRPMWRAGRGVALSIMVGGPLLIGLGLSAVARDPGLDPQGRLFMFLLRAFVAPLHLLAHLNWLRAATRTLEADGALKP